MSSKLHKNACTYVIINSHFAVAHIIHKLLIAHNNVICHVPWSHTFTCIYMQSWTKANWFITQAKEWQHVLAICMIIYSLKKFNWNYGLWKLLTTRIFLSFPFEDFTQSLLIIETLGGWLSSKTATWYMDFGSIIYEIFVVTLNLNN